jgi:uncharacterized Zn finger protein
VANGENGSDRRAGNNERNGKSGSGRRSKNGAMKGSGEGDRLATASAIIVPPVHAALPKRLGHFPFWRAKDPFLQSMDSIYKKASDTALSVLSNGE